MIILSQDFNNSGCLLIFYQYIVKLLEEVCIENNIKSDICFQPNQFIYDGKHINISVNQETTLVKQEGFDSNQYYELSTLRYGDKYYTIRFAHYETFIKSHISLDYSILNLMNVATSKNNSLLNKQVHIPSCLIDYNPFTRNRSIDIITSFIDVTRHRRAQILQWLRIHNIHTTNVTNIFTKEDNINLFSNTKICLNLHQTDFHDTFEELRCLPALLCGCLVISEESPFMDEIPYRDYIIWSKTDDLLYTIFDVIQNYDSYYNKIFINSNLKEIIDNMKVKAKNNLRDMVIKHDKLLNNY